MHPFPIDMYAYHNRLRDAHPAEKMLFAGLTMLVCLIASSPLVALLALAFVTVAVVRVAGIPLRAFWFFVRLPTGFILLGVLTLAITSVDPANPETLVALPVGPWHVGVMESSLARAVQVTSVSFACVASMLALALTTPMVDITDQLRKWRVPQLFIELMVLMYRFIFVFIETAQAMYIAQNARLGYSNWRRSLHSVGMLAANLYLRSQTRAAALFTALTARGYTGELRVLTAQPVWSRRNLALIAGVESVLLLATVATWSRVLHESRRYWRYAFTQRCAPYRLAGTGGVGCGQGQRRRTRGAQDRGNCGKCRASRAGG